MGNDGVNMSGDLDSIGSLTSGDLGEDRLFISLEGWPPEETC